MPSADVAVTAEVGLHARPAAVFVRAASGYQCDVHVTKCASGSAGSSAKGEGAANGKSLLSILKLDVRFGDSITITTDGEDADAALTALTALAATL